MKLSKPGKTGNTAVPDNVRELLEYKPPKHRGVGRYHKALTIAGRAMSYAGYGMVVGAAGFQLVSIATGGPQLTRWEQMLWISCLLIWVFNSAVYQRAWNQSRKTIEHYRDLARARAGVR